MNPVKIVKIVANLVVGLGTGKIAKDIIQYNTPDYDKKRDKLMVGVSSAVIGTMAAERTSSWVDRQIDGVVDGINQIRNHQSTDDQS